MNKFALLLSGCMLAATIVNSALADDYGGSGVSREKIKGGSGMGMMKGECLMDGQGMHGSYVMTGVHSMTGKADNVDHDHGTLMLKHAAAYMMLHFPPAAIKDIKDGDTITIRLGITKEAVPK